MPANLQSPRVTYEESDRSGFVTPVGSSVAFLLMATEKGKVAEGVLYIDRSSFIEGVGEPKLSIPAMHGALAVLQQTPFWGMRVASGQKFSTSQRFIESIAVTIASGTEEAPNVYSTATLAVNTTNNVGEVAVLANTEAIWTSSDELTATVDASGVVTALLSGATTVTITADYNGIINTFDIDVSID